MEEIDFHHEIEKKYNEENETFRLNRIIEPNENDQILGYSCLYHYDQYQIEFEFILSTRLWKIRSTQINDQQLIHILNLLFEDFYQIQCLTLDEQIQLIIQRLNEYYQEKNEEKDHYQDENQIENSLKYFHDENLEKESSNELIEFPLIDESKQINHIDHYYRSKDVQDFGLRSLINGSSRSKFSSLMPPPVAPRRSRQNSSCSTQSSVRYASFFPPPTAPIRRRRIIQSILLHVQRKKKPFEKFFDIFKTKQSITIDQLGQEFLRLYDGKFNYQEGHTLTMFFEKRTWFLTIDKIKCIECQIGEPEPRSVLLLNYKHQLTRVQI